VNGIGFDSAGNVYVAGWTTSPGFPATTTTRLPLCGPICREAQPRRQLTDLLVSIRRGGIAGLAIGPSGNAYVAGLAGCNMTATPGAFQTQPKSLAAQGYVGKLNEAGSGWIT